MLPVARILSGFFLLSFLTTTWAIIPIPELSHRVTDLTATFTPAQAAALERKLAAFEAEKGSQIAVLMVATTQPEEIEQFGIRVADTWKIGRKKIDDGVILLVAKNDRKLRLEVGYGLEGIIPDAIAKRVISETITPFFKQGDFVGGIDAGISQLMQLIKGEPLPPPQESTGAGKNEGSFIFILVAGMFAGSILSALLGRMAGSAIAALGSAAIAAMFFGLGFAIFIGFLIFILMLGGVGHRRGGSGWSSGGGFGGSSGGGSWSGGGGGFGGGGASGSW